MSTVLKPLLALQDQPGMPEAIGKVVAQAHGKVCSVCGLERMGHAPESGWLGFAPHNWDGIPATADDMARASALTSQAYRLRRAALGG